MGALQFVWAKFGFSCLCVYSIADIVWSAAAFVVLSGQEQKTKCREESLLQNVLNSVGHWVRL